VTEPRARWGGFAALAVGAALLFALLMLGHRRYDPAAALAIAGAASVAELAAAALALAMFRRSRDPQALFVGAGFLVLAVQEALFGIWWPLAHDIGGYFAVTVGTTFGSYGVAPLIRAPVYAWLAGWVVAANLFLLAHPWRDRRGQPAVRASTILGSAAVVTAAVDLIVYRQFRASRLTAGEAVPDLSSLRNTGAVGVILGIAGAVLLLVAAERMWRTQTRAAPLRRWLAASYVLAIPLVLAVVKVPTPGTGYVQPADLLAPLVAALAFVGFLLAQRSSDSRMRRATDRAEEVLGGRAEIASMIAHEIRGPVATVRGIAGTSLTHYERLSDDERREFLGMIETESRRLLTTVDQMSIALKLDAGSLRLNLIPQDLADMVRAGVVATEPGAHEITVDAQPGVSVPADRTRLIEVVRQLVDNAVKFSPPEAPIKVTARREDDRATIEVVDAGPGIPPDRREHLFTKFPNWRPAGYEEQPGTGLGLFICRGLLAEHSGEIDIEDGPDGGTMLRVRLPVEG
jgi:signal transduction histidine kinase